MPVIWKALGFANPQASRLFIDLIRDVTSKWANWDPGLPVKVGDYGILNKETGELEIMGNIYHASFQEEDTDLRELLDQNPVNLAPPEDDFYAVSLNGRKTEIDLALTASVPGLAQATIKGRWSFKAKRGAFLLMSRPQISFISRGNVLERLAEVDVLKGMCLVTQAFRCSAYSLYLSNEKNDDVSVALIGSGPVPHIPGATVGGQLQARWWSSTAAGLFRNGLQHDGQERYTPLYALKTIRGKISTRRGQPDTVLTGDDLWVDVDPPWDLLDENGDVEAPDMDGDKGDS